MISARSILAALIVVTGFAGLTLHSLPARAFSWNEIGDAGELLPTVQGILGTGPLNSISGPLIDLGSGTDDIDLYRFVVDQPSSFSVTVSSALSVDNDSQLFLFNESGSLILADDDDGPDLLPQLIVGDLSSQPAGIYILGFNLYDSDPSANPLTGWNRDPDPFQTGPYTLTITGSTGVSAVPGPLPIISVGVAFGWSRKLRKRIKSSKAEANLTVNA